MGPAAIPVNRRRSRSRDIDSFHRLLRVLQPARSGPSPAPSIRTLLIQSAKSFSEPPVLLYSRPMSVHTAESESPRHQSTNRFRRHPRVRIAAPFVCALSPLKARRWLRRQPVDLGVVYDLSVRGARVSTEAAIKPGDEIMLTIRLPRQIRAAEVAIATVRWTKDQFFGLAFKRLSADAHSRLNKFVTITSQQAV